MSDGLPHQHTPEPSNGFDFSDPSSAGAEATKEAGALTALRPILPVVAMVVAMWAAEAIDWILNGRLDHFGVRPRSASGFLGILFAPLLHIGFGHLIANSVPFVVLGIVICVSSTRHFLFVTACAGLVGGVGVWLIGPSNSVHIGASGLVFGYLSYLLTRGIFARSAVYLAVGAVILAIYGSVLWGVLPRAGISWQGHVFGAIGGVLAASLMHRQERVGA